jgi:hypothetical protein
MYKMGGIYRQNMTEKTRRSDDKGSAAGQGLMVETEVATQADTDTSPSDQGGVVAGRDAAGNPQVATSSQVANNSQIASNSQGTSSAQGTGSPQGTGRTQETGSSGVRKATAAKANSNTEAGPLDQYIQKDGKSSQTDLPVIGEAESIKPAKPEQKREPERISLAAAEIIYPKDFNLFDRRQMQFLLGKRLYQTVQLDNGQVMQEGEYITAEMLSRVRSRGTLMELTAHVKKA